MSSGDPVISERMLADIEFIHRQLKVMGKGFDKRITADYVGQTIEFIKGALFEQRRAVLGKSRCKECGAMLAVEAF